MDAQSFKNVSPSVLKTSKTRFRYCSDSIHIFSNSHFFWNCLSMEFVIYFLYIYSYNPLFTHSRSSTIIHHRPWSEESRIHPGSLNRQKKHFIYFSSDSEMRNGTLSKIKCSWKGLCWCISRFKMFTISDTNKYNNFIQEKSVFTFYVN